MDKRKTSGVLTREYMVTALLLLMEEKDYDNISITDITEKAGVSRMAYYRNYKDKDEILMNYLMEIGKGLNEAITSRGKVSLHRLIVNVGTFIQENINLILAIGKTGQGDKVFSVLSKCVEASFPEIRSSKKNEYLAQFYIGAVISTFRHWFETGMGESVYEIADMLCDFIDADSRQKFEIIAFTEE